MASNSEPRQQGSSDGLASGREAATGRHRRWGVAGFEEGATSNLQKREGASAPGQERNP